MLKVFRDNLKRLSWALWVVIAALVIFLFVDFGTMNPGGRPATTAAVKVGDDEITYGEFQSTYQQLESTYRQAYGGQFSPELARQLRLPQQVLEQLIQEKILLQEADRMGLTVTDEELQAAILELPVFKDENGAFIGQEVYDQILRANALTAESFEAGMRNQLRIQKLNAILAQNLYVSDQDVEKEYREQVERAAVRFVRLPADRFREEVSFDGAELAAYFAENGESFRLPERRSVHFLKVDNAAVRDSVEVGDDEVRTYYDENPDEFTREPQVRARHILIQTGEKTVEQARAELQALKARIEAGEDFATVAAAASDDPGTKNQGGDLGFFGRGRMVQAFEEAAFNGKPGELIGPVQTAFGVHLIEVLEKQEGGLRPFEEVEPTLRARLTTERARDASHEKIGKLAKAAAKKPGLAQFQELAAEDPAAEAKTTEPFGRDDNVDGIGRATAFSVAAFDLAENELSEPVRLANGWALLYLDAIEEPRIPELHEVEDQVRARLTRDRSVELARRKLDEARAEIEGGKTLDTVAAGLGVQPEESGEFARGGPVGTLGVQSQLSEAALEMSEGEVAGPFEVDNAMVLFEVTSRTRFDPALFEQSRAQTLEAVRSERLNELLYSLITERRRALDITYDPALVENFQLAVQG